MATPGIEASSDPAANSVDGQLTEAERELILEELKKTEDEVATLRQVLAVRQKQVAHLKHKLGISPFNELTSEMAQGIRTVKETPAFQKTSEFVGGTAETVANKFNDIRKSSFFKSFETKIGSAVNNARMVASTSIDHLANVAGGTRTPHESGERVVVGGSPPPPPLS
uniref:Tumor protein D52 n=1 Tax=Meloidogyne hapla TaxID=6305 RepID=A0A1I8BK93_MELHA